MTARPCQASRRVWDSASGRSNPAARNMASRQLRLGPRGWKGPLPARRPRRRQHDRWLVGRRTAPAREGPAGRRGSRGRGSRRPPCAAAAAPGRWILEVVEHAQEEHHGLRGDRPGSPARRCRPPPAPPGRRRAHAGCRSPARCQAEAGGIQRCHAGRTARFALEAEEAVAAADVEHALAGEALGGSCSRCSRAKVSRGPGVSRPWPR